MRRNIIPKRGRGQGGQTYLRLSITDRCNLRCRYCRPGTGFPQSVDPPLSDEALVHQVKRLHAVRPIGKIRLTGGEPLLREGVVGLVRQLREALPDAVLGITTNGTMLARLAPSLAAAGVTRVNISLDTLDSARFRSVTKAKLEKVLSGVEAAQEAGFPHLKLNAVLQRTINGDQLPRLVRYAENAGTELRFIELMPVGCAAHLYKEEHLSAADALMKLRRSFPYLKDLGITGTAQRHLLQVGGRDFAIGFIAPVSHPFCGTCNRLRLDAYGRLSPCLRSTKSYDLATASDVRVARVLAGAEQGHRQQATAWPDRRMVSIGG